MIDRNVEFPNRFRMTKVEGTDDIYDLIPAPGEVIAPGDTFSKANMLPDSIPAALGLKMGNPQVKDALNVLANIGNVHVWQRVQTYADLVPYVDYLTSTDPNAYPKQSAEGGRDASYELGDVVSGYLFASAWDGNASNYYYSETIKVSDTGTLTQENVKHYTANATNDSWVSNIQSAIRGKFITVSGETNNGGSEGTNLVYIPDDAIVSYFENGVSLGYPYNYGFLVNKMQQVTGYPAIPANTVITYLGQLGEPGAKIEVGSYVGTGTYGADNPNSLTFGFEPKFVFIKQKDYRYHMSLLYGDTKATTDAGTSSSEVIETSWNNKTLTWYNVYDEYRQMNESGKTYNYIAMG